jgi:hypothetical protein
VPDEVLAQARRLHHHVMSGGNVTAMDMSRLVQGMERMQAERDRLREALYRIGLPGKQIVYCRDGHEEAVLHARAALGDDRA